MKTFNTDIPKGATHYYYIGLHSLGYYKLEEGEWYFWYDVDNWTPVGVDGLLHAAIPIKLDEEIGSTPSLSGLLNGEQVKAVIEELGENDNKVEWGGEGLPPVGVECWFNFKTKTPEKCKVKYIGGRVCVYEDESGEEYSILLSCVKFSKPETEAERIERERESAIYDMCASADNFTEEANFWASKFYDLGYTKESNNG